MPGQKRVRFDFSTISGGSSLEELSGDSEIEQEGPSSLLPTSISVGQRAISAAKATASALSPRNLFTSRGRHRRASVPAPERVRIRKRIPNSITFPMSTKQTADEGFDFGEPPAKDTKSKEQREAEAKACIRRLSLKEFSGLDPQPRPAQHQYATSYASPLMTRLPRASIAAETYGHLLDNYSNHRRRSTASLNRVGLETSGNGIGSRDNIYDYFDKAISECSASACASPARVPTTETVHPIPANIDFALLYERICHIRNRLRATLDSIPSASPKKQHSVEAEKADLLRELSGLATACKNMVRAVSSYPHPTKADLFVHSYEAVESADHVTGVAENLIVKSKSLFQAQLMNAKTEQMLKALFETISDVERTHGAVRPTGEARKAIKSSTTLAATLTQLIHSVRGV